MPSTYSSNLKIELQATGENSGTWGSITNTNLGTALEQAIVGYGNPDFASDASLTLSYTDSNAAQAARALVLNVTSTGNLTATRDLVVPTIEKQYVVQNNTSGSQSITVKTSGGTGITVPNGLKAHLYVDGTNVILMDDYVDINGGSVDGTPIGANSASTGAFTNLSATSLTLTNALGTAEGGTGVDSTPTNGQLLIGNGSGFALSTLTAGSGVTITNSAGSITLTATGTGGTLTSVDASSTLSGVSVSGGPITTSGVLTIAGTLGIASGGTGLGSTPTNGQLLIGNGTGFALSTLTAGSGMTITNNAGSITLAAGGLPPVTISDTVTISATAGNHYVLTAASLTTVTLPASPTISDTIYVTVANGLTTNVVDNNGKPIQGISESLTLNAAYASVQLRFTNDTEGWVFA